MQADDSFVGKRFLAICVMECNNNFVWVHSIVLMVIQLYLHKTAAFIQKRFSITQWRELVAIWKVLPSLIQYFRSIVHLFNLLLHSLKLTLGVWWNIFFFQLWYTCCYTRVHSLALPDTLSFVSERFVRNRKCFTVLHFSIFLHILPPFIAFYLLFHRLLA